MRIKFSLRWLLILFTIVSLAAIFVGWRCNQRSKSQIAAQRIQDQGGEVLYRWQKPRTVKSPVIVFPIVNIAEVPYTETLPDGSQVVRTRTEMFGRNTPNTALIEEFRVGSVDPPGFRVASFLLGSHDDVAISALSIPAAAVEESTVSLLRDIHGLERVLLRVNRHYYAFESSKRATAEQRAQGLERYGEYLKRATELIEKHLPKITLHRRGFEPRQDWTN